MESIMKLKIFIYSMLISVGVYAQDIDWAHNKTDYKGSGQVTVKDLSGNTVNINNTKNVIGVSTSSAPLVLASGGGSSYKWGGAVYSGGIYYVYEQNLDTIIEYSPADFTAQFTYDSINVYKPAASGWTGQVYDQQTLRAYASSYCGDAAYRASNSCTLSCSKSSGTRNISSITYTSAPSCTFYDGASMAGQGYLHLSTYGWSLQINSYTNVSVALAVPTPFNAYFGNTITSSDSNARAVGSGGPSPEGARANTASSTSRTDIRYYFDTDWMGSGHHVGYVFVTRNNGSNHYRFMSRDYTVNNNFPDVPLIDATATHYYRHIDDGGGQSTIVKLKDDGTDDFTVIARLPVSAGSVTQIIEIKGHTPPSS